MKKQKQKGEELLNTLVYAYLVILFAGLPLYMQDKLVMIGNAKYLFFRNTTLTLGAFIMMAALWQRIRGEKTQTVKEQRWKKTDLCMVLYLISAALSSLLSPCREVVFLGYPGWYMGLLTQTLLVGIYFMVSRYYDGSRSIWWIAGITAGISMATAYYGKKYVRVLGMIGSFLFFASAITSNSTTAILAACGLSLLLFLISLRQRTRLLRALEILMLLPLSIFMVRLFLLLHLTGLVIAGDVEKRLFFTTVWYIVFGAEAVLYLILRIRERQQQKDFLESGKIYRIVVVAGAVMICSGVLLGCLLGGIVGNEMVSEAANGRLALWKVTLLTYGKEGVLYKFFGNGPGSYYHMLYQWGSDAMDWINKGLLDNNIYSNAHNEWLTLLIEQGILGEVAFSGIFITAFTNLRKKLSQSPECLAIFLGLVGYLICSLFTFQHVLSTPFAFALLGMARGVLL